MEKDKYFTQTRFVPKFISMTKTRKLPYESPNYWKFTKKSQKNCENCTKNCITAPPKAQNQGITPV